jgi:hypothetical protein
MRDAFQEAVNDLNLSDDQKGKVKDIFADAKAKRQAIWNDASLGDDQKKAKIKELHADTKAKVRHQNSRKASAAKFLQHSKICGLRLDSSISVSQRLGPGDRKRPDQGDERLSRQKTL